MTVGQAIQLARELKRIDEVNYPDALMVHFINECEGKIQTEFLHIAPVDCQTYTTDDMEKDLIIGPPHDKLYYTYLCAMIDFTNGEYTKYNNAIIIANSFMAEWAAWFNRTHKRDGREFLGVFLSAYGIAVKRGFTGTEEEWLETLVGPPGVSGVYTLGEDETLEDAPDDAMVVIDPKGVSSEDGNPYDMVIEANPLDGYGLAPEHFNVQTWQYINTRDKLVSGQPVSVVIRGRFHIHSGSPVPATLIPSSVTYSNNEGMRIFFVHCDISDVVTSHLLEIDMEDGAARVYRIRHLNLNQ